MSIPLWHTSGIIDRHLVIYIWNNFVWIITNLLTCKSLSSMSYCQSREFRINLQQRIRTAEWKLRYYLRVQSTLQVVPIALLLSAWFWCFWCFIEKAILFSNLVKYFVFQTLNFWPMLKPEELPISNLKVKTKLVIWRKTAYTGNLYKKLPVTSNP